MQQKQSQGATGISKLDELLFFGQLHSQRRSLPSDVGVSL